MVSVWEGQKHGVEKWQWQVIIHYKPRSVLIHFSVVLALPTKATGSPSSGGRAKHSSLMTDNVHIVDDVQIDLLTDQMILIGSNKL